MAVLHDPARRLSRRRAIHLGAATAGAVALGADLPRRAAGQATPTAGDGGPLVFLSTQLEPADEAAAMRTAILAGYPGAVEFVPGEFGPFVDRVVAEAALPRGTVGLLGGQHGDIASLAAAGVLADVSGLAVELGDRGFIPQYLELGRFGGSSLAYVPWMQATYVMVARREALAYLPPGVDENTLQTSLTYVQLAAWAAAIAAAEGPRLGLPGGTDGLLHRFLQGYAYPSFTGALNTRFASDDAVTMWQWLRDVWRFADPRSVSYDAMAKPLLSGEVWLAWDHVARLIGALRERREDFVAFPAPRGPLGLGFMPVIGGLAIPRNAPDPAAARALIEFLTRPEIQTLTLREVAWFPAIETDLPDDLEPGVLAAADAVLGTIASEVAVPSLLPVGLGARNESYNAVFRDAFRGIVLDGGDPRQVLATQGASLQAILDGAQAACWTPDPVGPGVCRVG